MTDPLAGELVGDQFGRVFASVDPFDEPFTANAPARAILFPLGPGLAVRAFEALAVAARAVGDDTCYVAFPGVDERHHHVALDDWRSYVRVVVGDTIVHYGVAAPWGLITAYEWHAVAGGPMQFLEALRGSLPDAPRLRPPGEAAPPAPFDEQVYEFLDYLRGAARRYGTEMGWLPILLTHVYGSARGNELLAYFRALPGRQ